MEIPTPEEAQQGALEIDLRRDSAPTARKLPEPHLELKPYIPERQRDYVRLIVTTGLFSMLGWIVVWACIASSSSPDHWAQTKEMLQMVLPALTGLIGSVLGFYFGSAAKSSNSNKSGRGRTARLDKGDVL